MKNLLTINVNVSITGGVYAGGSFAFEVRVPPSYPFHAPQCRCLTRTWHPNIDLATGVVQLPSLGKDWRPVLSINTVVFSLQLMFVEANPEDACNLPAAETLSRAPREFARQVAQTLRGGCFFGLVFEPNQSAVALSLLPVCIQPPPPPTPRPRPPAYSPREGWACFRSAPPDLTAIALTLPPRTL